MRPANTRRTRGRRSARGRRRPEYRRRRLGLAAVLGAMVLFTFVLSVIFSGKATPAGADEVRVIKVDGIIDPLMGDYVTRSIGDAENDQVRAVVLQLDTPGGLDQPMRDVIQKMAGSPLPIIVYVAPTGARAASAGTFICMGADACAMAPGTNLGAAHPVAIGTGPDTETGIKITSDAAAYMRSLAETNGHNANWAELAVRQSVSLSADEALQQQVIDKEADSMQSLLDQLNGFTTKAKQITINTQGAGVSEASMTFRETFLHFIVNPNVAYLLLIIGLLAIAYEFVHPGIGIGAIGGFICLALSLYGLYVLPIDYVGVALIVLGIAFLAAELYLPTHGALTAGGIIALLAGSFFLYDSSAPFLRVSMPLTIALAALSLGFFLVIARAAVQARRLPKKSPRNAMVGEVGVTRTRLDPLGQVFVRGEIWSAEAPEGETVEKGEEVEVTDARGLLLRVRRTA